MEVWECDDGEAPFKVGDRVVYNSGMYAPEVYPVVEVFLSSDERPIYKDGILRGSENPTWGIVLKYQGKRYDCPANLYEVVEPAK